MNTPKAALLSFLVIAFPMLVRAEFAFRDGDTVAFLGDSITAARGYTKLVEEYSLLRFPNLKLHFVNAGKGGDTTSGSLERLDRDVFSKHATVVTVAFGINDIGWGMKADAEHKKLYLDGIRGIVEACKKHNVRVYICSPAITAEDPDKAEKGFLQSMTDEGLALAKSLGAGTVDLQRGMREIQRRVVKANEKETDVAKKTLLHVSDGVHLSDFGQLVMGYALLKGLDAPAEVSSMVIDAKTEQVVETKGCKVSKVRKRNDGMEFVRLDEGLPLNLGTFGALNFRFIPIPDNINRYMLTVRNLPPGEYDILAEGRLLGHTSAERLQNGLNISSMTSNPWEPGGPWEAQSDVIKELTEARDKNWMGGKLSGLYLAEHSREKRLDKQNETIDDEIVRLQRATAKPYPYRFEIRKHAESGKAGN